MARGLNNNNPGNLRISNEKWDGEIIPSSDPEFKQFQTIAYGYRALLKLLYNYIAGGHNTINKIIYRWSPPNENDTEGYIANVERKTNINRNTVLDNNDQNALTKIGAAISELENGVLADMDNVNAGWDLFEKKKTT